MSTTPIILNKMEQNQEPVPTIYDVQKIYSENPYMGAQCSYSENVKLLPQYPAYRNPNGTIIANNPSTKTEIFEQMEYKSEKQTSSELKFCPDFTNMGHFPDTAILNGTQTLVNEPPSIFQQNPADYAGHKRKNSNATDDSIKAKKSLSTTIEEKKNINLRKNIRDVMNETQLDTNTIEAQKEEAERLARVAGQQKSLREIQKQIAVCKRIMPLLQERESDEQILEDSILTDKAKACFLEEQVNTVKDIPNEVSIISDEKVESTFESVVKNKSLVDEEDTEECQSIAADIVTIEDSSSDDDCILLSEDEEFNEGEDVNNSGMHVNDAYNIPDELGRVVVNVGHPEGEEAIYLAPQIAQIIKPHQIGGVRFLYDNIVESTKRFKKSSGFGCILAHSMGLGKTLQVISFCDIFLRHTSAKNILCVMPINTLQNWLSEFNMWLPRTSPDENTIQPRNFEIFLLNDQQKTLSARAKVILSWAQEGGVLLIGYELFRLLALKLIPSRKKRSRFSFTGYEGSDAGDLIDAVHKALVKPGPDLIICDEGHRIKNSHAGISQALKQIRTRRRIVLTGYPLQNNLLEYWCMVDFVRPNYLGTRTEFCNMFERPIQNGQCVDSTPDDIRLMRYRAHVLHSLLVGFVQRRSHEVLHLTLPEKLEYVVLVKMTPFQRKLYDTFMTDVVRKKAFPNPLKAFAVCCKIWNHPDVLYNFLKKCETDLDLEIDDELTKNSANNLNPTTTGGDSSNISKNLNSSTVTMVNNDQPTTNSQGGDSNAIINPNVDQNSRERSNDGVVPSIPQTTVFEDSTKMKPEPLIKNQPSVDVKMPPDPNKRCGMNYFLEGEENYGSYLSDNRPNSFWLDTTIPSKPSYVATMVQQPHAANGLENASESSEIVDLDTNEIKTIESDIRANAFQHNMKQDVQDPCNDSINKSLAVSNAKDPLINCDINKKLPKNKRCDEFSCTWAIDLMKNYEPGKISNSPKMELFFCILRESICLGDRMLLFSQSLLTLNLIEGFLKSSYVPGECSFWTRNVSYFRLDGSTSSQEREKLVNEFNANTAIKLFLISTRAGSLGINLTGANRVIIFDASWNPCHDTQAVYRIYRYGQKKPCYVYRIVMDKCLEKKIYDRQIKKQGMSDRVVDECNPEAHLSLKDVTNLCHDYDSGDDDVTEVPQTKPCSEEKSKESTDLSKTEETTTTLKPVDNNLTDSNDKTIDNVLLGTEIESSRAVYTDSALNKIIECYKNDITKDPFLHESLLVDRKDRKLSQAEKRQAHRSYEMEKKASVSQKLNYSTSKIQYKIVRNDGTVVTRPVASIRPMQTKKTQNNSTGNRATRWIPAEVWQRQGMTAQEMTLPLDVVIPTNSSEKSNIILKAGQRVMVLKSAKGIYMQLDSGKIIAIRTTSKTLEREKDSKTDVIDITSDCDSDAPKKATDVENAMSKADKPKAKTSDIGEKNAPVLTKVENIQGDINKKYSESNGRYTSLTGNQTVDRCQQPQPQTQQQPQQPQQSQQSQQPHQAHQPQQTHQPQQQPQHQPQQSHQPQQQQHPQQAHQRHDPQKFQVHQNQREQAKHFPYHLPQPSHQLPVVKQQSFMSQFNPQQRINNNSLNMQPNVLQSSTLDSHLNENSYFQNKEGHAYAPQYYDYFDNKTIPCSYPMNDYSAYTHFNYPPYHSHLYPSNPYGGSSSAYINPNAFPRHWNPPVNPTATNDRAQASELNGGHPRQWSPE